MTISFQVEVVDKLQKICAEIYIHVVASLKTGMSEKDIAEMVRREFSKRGINEYWYDVPIMILIGEDRFLDMAKPDYALKSPSEHSLLREGNSIFIDMHPMDSNGFWGDYSAMSVFKPEAEDQDKVAFLREVFSIQRQGINAITTGMRANVIANLFKNTFAKNNIISLDVRRSNVGHSMHKGPKKNADGTDKRTFIESGVTVLLDEGIYAIEPGGFQKKNDGRILVGRFEDCVYVPKKGRAMILGNTEPLMYSV